MSDTIFYLACAALAPAAVALARVVVAHRLGTQALTAARPEDIPATLTAINRLVR